MSNSYVIPWTVARQAPLSMGFPRQRILEGVAISSRESLPDPGTEPTSPAWQVDSLPLSRLGSPRGSRDETKPVGVKLPQEKEGRFLCLCWTLESSQENAEQEEDDCVGLDGEREC